MSRTRCIYEPTYKEYTTGPQGSPQEMIDISAIRLHYLRRSHAYWAWNESEDADVEPGKAGENLGKSGRS
jgi:hypothetical protein